MALKRIRLELARDPEFPEGSSAHGYDLIAPLTEDGHLDAAEWRAHRDSCRVTRFWRGEPDEIGHLRHYPGGAWGFHYDIRGDAETDEPGFKLDRHVFLVGEYVSLLEQDGEMRTFRVAQIRP